ncbi:MAG: hypothetical protein E5X60_00945 [Mesorhizobium sp.]|nr:MAG: hypothetical protein E5X60_00945 [Mesorhizobium sp.]
MSEYIGLDMSLKEAALSVRRDRKRIWRGAHFCATCIRATRFIPPLCECSANHAGRYEGYFSFCARARSARSQALSSLAAEAYPCIASFPVTTP